jgi:hypothetical protein
MSKRMTLLELIVNFTVLAFAPFIVPDIGYGIIEQTAAASFYGN